MTAAAQESVREFRLPDVGEGLTEAEVLTWHVAVGDVVTVNQVLVEIETAKAAVELPSPFAGVVTALLVEEGATVPVGTPIIAIDTAGGGSGAVADVGAVAETVPPDAAPVSAAESEQWAGGAAPAAPESKREAVLVGYGVAPTSATRRPRKRPVQAVPDAGGRTGATEPGEELVVGDRLTEPSREDSSVALRRGGFEVATAVQARVTAGDGSVVRAKPPVRKRAKDLGVDLRLVTPTGAHGDVTRADVEGASALAGAHRPTESGAREERIPVRGVLRSMAQAMVRSSSTAPHVTEWVTVDVTETMRLVERLRTMPELEGGAVGPMLVAAWALCRAVGRHPRINATWDEEAAEVVVKHYVNLGIAAATPRGLVVPNVKDAQDLDLAGLAHALKALTSTARDGRTSPADMLGGTISITNVGVFGVDGGTPILPPGEGAILCLGQVATRPWVVDGAVVPRAVCELTLSFDHRFVDGELGSLVLADVARTLSDPAGELVRASLR